MSTKAISVTEAARNFADCINRAHYQGATFVLHKNGVPMARIVPYVKEKDNTGRAIAAALAKSKVRLSPEESAAWLRDLEESRNKLIPPVDKWKS
jgi:antitoxin (DNA-binding transcriptional repressor) of toxin-antitoxin stability system